jgi:hypothetical protein
MMRSFRLYSSLSVLVVLALLCSGCSVPGQGSSGGNGGHSDITVSPMERTTLDEAISSLRKAERDELQDLVGMKITQVMGVRVDLDGKARTWTLGFKGLNSTKVLEYHAGDWTRLDLELPLPDEEILIDQLIPPEQLYAARRDRIREALDRHGATESDLLLARGVYTITVPSPSGTTVLIFDARTGEMK